MLLAYVVGRLNGYVGFGICIYWRKFGYGLAFCMFWPFACFGHFHFWSLSQVAQKTDFIVNKTDVKNGHIHQFHSDKLRVMRTDVKKEHTHQFLIKKMISKHSINTSFHYYLMSNTYLLHRLFN